MSDLTPSQLDILRHTLGTTRNQAPYRDHFVAGPGHDSESNLTALVAAGYMEIRRRPAFLHEDDVVYGTTAKGRETALANPVPEGPPPTAYQSYLNADSSRSFAEWLGIEAPRLETEYSSSWPERQGRGPHYRYRSTRATGAWKNTKKDAKASYKADLRMRREQAKRNAAATKKPAEA